MDGYALMSRGDPPPSVDDDQTDRQMVTRLNSAPLHQNYRPPQLVLAVSEPLRAELTHADHTGLTNVDTHTDLPKLGALTLRPQSDSSKCWQNFAGPSPRGMTPFSSRRFCQLWRMKNQPPCMYTTLLPSALEPPHNRSKTKVQHLRTGSVYWTLGPKDPKYTVYITPRPNQ